LGLLRNVSNQCGRFLEKGHYTTARTYFECLSSLLNEKHMSLTSGTGFSHPLLNFSKLLLMCLEKGGPQDFSQLIQVYGVHITDPSIVKVSLIQPSSTLALIAPVTRRHRREIFWHSKTKKRKYASRYYELFVCTSANSTTSSTSLF
jgi:hypothetical protein